MTPDLVLVDDPVEEPTEADTPEELEVEEHRTPILVVEAYDVLAAEVAGLEVVTLVVQATDHEEHVILTFALPSEDAHRIARSLISVASTVRLFSVQTRIIEAVTAREESNEQ